MWGCVVSSCLIGKPLPNPDTYSLTYIWECSRDATHHAHAEIHEQIPKLIQWLHMNNEQQKVIEIHWLLNMHEANPEDTHFLMPNPWNAILTPNRQMPGGWSVHFVSICLMMQLGYRLLLLLHRSFTWALSLIHSCTSILPPNKPN